jgi:hypothetical protein
MVSIFISKSISIYKFNDKEKFEPSKKLLIKNENDALKILLEYFSERINNKRCQACEKCSYEESIFEIKENSIVNKNYTYMTEATNQEYIKNEQRKQHINTCYFTAVQIQIAEFFRSFDLNFDKKLTYQEFYKGFTSLFVISEWKNKKLSNFKV